MDDSVRTLLGRLLRLAITLAVIGVLLNDGIQVGLALSRASKGLNAAMGAALDSAGAAPEAVDAGRAAAMTAAESQATRLDTYDQKVGDSMGSRRAQVTLAVSAGVGRTVVAAPIIGLIRGTPRASWYADPRVVLNSTKQVDVYGAAQ